jgi:hypothetical protein
VMGLFPIALDQGLPFASKRDETDMNILLLNAGSSSLKCTLMESAEDRVVARGLADWAGSKTYCQYVGLDGSDRSEEVSWRGHAKAAHRFGFDPLHAKPVALTEASALAAVGLRAVHGGQLTSSERITPQIRSRIIALQCFLSAGCERGPSRITRPDTRHRYKRRCDDTPRSAPGA